MEGSQGMGALITPVILKADTHQKPTFQMIIIINTVIMRKTI
jgi:hypothetical protein